MPEQCAVGNTNVTLKLEILLILGSSMDLDKRPY